MIQVADNGHGDTGPAMVVDREHVTLSISRASNKSSRSLKLYNIGEGSY